MANKRPYSGYLEGKGKMQNNFCLTDEEILQMKCLNLIEQQIYAFQSMDSKLPAHDDVESMPLYPKIDLPSSMQNEDSKLPAWDDISWVCPHPKTNSTSCMHDEDMFIVPSETVGVGIPLCIPTNVDKTYFTVDNVAVGVVLDMEKKY
uniref:Uncharacterized protein n=1 Tax=Helicotheca tamesis TaxID=374047 RepID=A0A7S2HKS6_9STRA|mmetsp:Transcript_18995/g.26167  ORF Transcript_18995/g.26167 Transcript_18995/m.26167 type:complete len:148 (+) Transcript_18995:255-698(+)|eukprot:CAMPEP_0185732984 /NCGR_PEP_ID=MMETSP1171-20130828/18090_1 /TAXON_ID=374046 /ORGANISM="Helicotheca tamensis, Strain CCMP826" /LENGTH=147 /DNA_ID=CAMNT_0028402599 /DNA_START=106 /DNA_END=549 /DNA_ORIENTATION=-